MHRRIRSALALGSLLALGAFIPAVTTQATADTDSSPAVGPVTPLASFPSSARVGITDIGTVNGRSSTAVGINRLGDVAGMSYVTGTIGIPNGPPADPFLSHGILYSGGVLTDLEVIDVGQTTCSPLGCQSWAFDVNDSRWVVGWNQGDQGLLASLWLPEAAAGLAQGWNLLPPLSSGQGSHVAMAINNSGQVVGRSSPDGIVPRAVVWNITPYGPEITDLGTLRSDTEGSATAWDINDLGQIVGGAADDMYYQHGFLYLPEPAYGLAAGMNDLMPRLEDHAHAVGINNHGEIAGEIAVGVPWVWLPQPAYGLPAGLSLLPLPRRIVAFFPTAISDAGQIVGQAYVLTNPSTRDYVMVAAAWRNGRWIMLDDLLPSTSPWDLFRAEGIARSGKTTLVSGGGRLNGVTDINGVTPAFHGFILAVTCPADLNDDGAVDSGDQWTLESHFGQTVPPGADGDLNGDGKVDSADLHLFANEVKQPCL